MAVLAVLLDPRHPERFPGFHVDVIAAGIPASLALELHQTSSVEVEGAAGLRLTCIANPSRAVVRKSALEFYIPEDLHGSEFATNAQT